jgi:type I restriction enzyme S subunit
MSHRWPMVPLGDILCRSEDWTEIDPGVTYREVTVRLWGKGVAMRREVAGSEIKTDRRLRVRLGQFILSRIDARNGAFGLVPGELDGAVVSNDSLTFKVLAGRLMPEFLGWMSKTATFVDLCRGASEGTTDRVRLKEDKFLSMTIPLPPLAEQRRIVAHLDGLQAKVDSLKALQAQTAAELDALLPSIRDRAFKGKL